MKNTIAIIIDTSTLPTYTDWLTNSITPPTHIILIHITYDHIISFKDTVAMLHLNLKSERVLKTKKQNATKILKNFETFMKNACKSYTKCIFTKIVVCGDENRKIRKCLEEYCVDMVVIDGDGDGDGCGLKVLWRWVRKGIREVVGEVGVPVLRIPVKFMKI